MAHRQACQHGNAQIRGALPQHQLERGGAFGIVAPVEAAEADGGQLLQRATEAPVGEQAIDPIGRLANVLQHQHGAVEWGQVSGAEQVGRHGEVAHQQRSLGGASAPAFPLQRRQGGTEQQIAQALLAPVRLGRQGGDHRAVDAAGSPCRLARPEQGGHIREAQQPAPAAGGVVALCAGVGRLG